MFTSYITQWHIHCHRQGDGTVSDLHKIATCSADPKIRTPGSPVGSFCWYATSSLHFKAPQLFLTITYTFVQQDPVNAEQALARPIDRGNARAVGLVHVNVFLAMLWSSTSAVQHGWKSLKKVLWCGQRRPHHSTFFCYDGQDNNLSMRGGGQRNSVSVHHPGILGFQ